jgi:hypothetical protein
VRKRVAVLQSNYIPWKGYFDLIHDVDLFVFYDDVQYTKGDWRNRNRIKTPRGVQWLTIPVGGRIHRRICDVAIPDAGWARRHLHALTASYTEAPFFAHYAGLLGEVYTERRWSNLSDFNQFVIRTIARESLGIDTSFGDSRDYGLHGRGQERLLQLLRATGATEYVSGPSADAYIEPRAFADAGIHLTWKVYPDYPVYEQLHPPFVHQVSILDLLFHVGPAAPEYIWGCRQ